MICPESLRELCLRKEWTAAVFLAVSLLLCSPAGLDLVIDPLTPVSQVTTGVRRHSQLCLLQMAHTDGGPRH